MCTKENLTVFNLGINTLLMLSAVTLTLMGILLVLNDDWDLAYEGTPTGWGAGLIMAALILTATACMAFYGTKKHNKCFLMLSVVCGLACCLIQYSVAQNIVVWLAPDVETTDMQGCVESEELAMWPSAECEALFASHDVLHLQYLWMAIYKESLENEARKQELVDIETSNYCCGIGPAEACDGPVVDAANFTLWGEEIAASPNPILTQVRRCSGRQPQVWYTESFYCQVPAGDLFGCPYMFSVSTSCLRDSNVRKGCLLALQEHVSGQVAPVASTIWVLLVFQALGIFAAFCLFLKRKAHDVLPPPDAFVDPRYLKYGRDRLKEPNRDGPATITDDDDVDFTAA
mmetsp:Transcript_15625/g.54273  ORF Transcript_15625/g.54273 Transcript_15625/m.54273 type:complete len:345 (-) Transcript_15625:41-1075(-)